MSILHISSVIVQVAEGRWQAITDYFNALEYVQISANDAQQNKLVVLLEVETLRETEDIINAMKDQSGVVSATMVYHHSETAAELNQPLYGGAQ